MAQSGWFIKGSNLIQCTRQSTCISVWPFWFWFTAFAKDCWALKASVRSTGRPSSFHLLWPFHGWRIYCLSLSFNFFFSCWYYWWKAKLGETNKFYYDEKLKRWVEEGAEPPAEEAALPPPPTTSAFQNGLSDYNPKPATKSEGSPTSGSPKFSSLSPTEYSSGMPPIPRSSNQFSARGRMGVRAR